MDNSAFQRMAYHPAREFKQKYLERAGMTANNLADAIRMPRKEVALILEEKRPVTIAFSVRVGMYFGIPILMLSQKQIEYETMIYMHRNLEDVKQIEAFK